MKTSIITLLSLVSLGISYTTSYEISPKDCIIVVSSDLRIDHDLDDKEDEPVSFACEVDSNIYPIKFASSAQKDDLKKKFNNGSLISSESFLSNYILTSFDGDNMITLPSDTQTVPIGRRTNNNRGPSLVEGDKPILAVRVIDIDGLAHADDAKTIGIKIFGNDPDATDDDPKDKVNLKSQMSACSFGKLNIINEYEVNIDKHLAAPGVIEVNIPISLKNSDRYKIHNAVTAAVKVKLGFAVPGPFQHVMYVSQRCYLGCGWAAYAYVNGWLSVYQGMYYKMAGVQLHGKFCVVVLHIGDDS